jgi:hypothetical protein
MCWRRASLIPIVGSPVAMSASLSARSGRPIPAPRPISAPSSHCQTQHLIDRGRILFRWRFHPDRVLADTKYSTVENVTALEAVGIKAYMPLRD